MRCFHIITCSLVLSTNSLNLILIRSQRKLKLVYKNSIILLIINSDLKHLRSNKINRWIIQVVHVSCTLLVTCCFQTWTKWLPTDSACMMKNGRQRWCRLSYILPCQPRFWWEGYDWLFHVITHPPDLWEVKKIRRCWLCRQLVLATFLGGENSGV